MNFALAECRYIWPEDNFPDLVVSAGTGTTEAESPKPTHFRHLFNDGFVPRIYRAYMASLDGQSTWQELETRIGDENPKHHFRLNVDLDKVPPIDDVDCMEKMRASVALQRDATHEGIELASAILIASFYFELDAVPRYEAGLFRCEGSIFCRNDARAVIRALMKIDRCPSKFFKDEAHLAECGGASEVCRECCRYRKRVAFYVKDLNSLITIYLSSSGGKRRRISGFPQTLRWFVERQRLDAAFGAPDASSRPECSGCRNDFEKRRALSVTPNTRPKKRHQSAPIGNYF